MILKKYSFMKGGDFVALTAKQQAFVAEYLIDFNATKAAERAGYSKKTADKQGTQLLAKPSISESIRDAIEARQRRTEITQDKVIKEIARYAFNDASDAVDSDFKHASKAKYIEMLCKHLGVYDSANRANDDRVTVVIDV